VSEPILPEIVGAVPAGEGYRPQNVVWVRRGYSYETILVQLWLSDRGQPPLYVIVPTETRP
jgi:hypothetical protein